MLLVVDGGHGNGVIGYAGVGVAGSCAYVGGGKHPGNNDTMYSKSAGTFQ